MSAKAGNASNAKEPHAAVAQSGSEKRFAPRRSSQITAILNITAVNGSVPCVVRDVSSTGARLELREGWDNPFSAGVSLNDRVQLVIRHDRVVYDCKIVRRGRKELGVKFVAAPKILPRPASNNANASGTTKKVSLLKKLASLGL